MSRVLANCLGDRCSIPDQVTPKTQKMVFDTTMLNTQHYKVLPDIGIMVRVLANCLGDRRSIPDRVILKTQKMVLDAALLNTQHYEVRIKGKVEQSREWSSALLYTLV